MHNSSCNGENPGSMAALRCSVLYRDPLNNNSAVSDGLLYGYIQLPYLRRVIRRMPVHDLS